MPMVVGLPGFLPGGDRVGVQPLGWCGVPGYPDTDHCLGYVAVHVCGSEHSFFVSPGSPAKELPRV